MAEKYAIRAVNEPVYEDSDLNSTIETSIINSTDNNEYWQFGSVNLDANQQSRLEYANECLSNHKNPIGALVGLSQKVYKLAIYLGNGSLAVVYEKGKGVNEAFNHVEKVLVNNQSIEGINSVHKSNLTEIVKDYDVYVYQSNVTWLNSTIKDYFKILRKNLSEMDKFKVGDVIAFDRSLYIHTAVLIDECNFDIIHRTGEIDNVDSGAILKTLSAPGLSEALIKRDNLIDSIEQSYIYVYNKLDGKYPPRKPNEIVEIAKSRLGETGYNIRYKNCQHFAFECRNNAEVSTSVETVRDVIVVGAFGLAATWLISQFAYSKKKPHKK